MQQTRASSTEKYPIHKPTSPDAGPHLVTGCGNRFREAKERQSQVEETILVGVKPSVPLNHFV